MYVREFHSLHVHVYWSTNESMYMYVKKFLSLHVHLHMYITHVQCTLHMYSVHVHLHVYMCNVMYHVSWHVHT